MFFRQQKPFELQETALPNFFFAQILPVADPLSLKIYLYGYYLSHTQEKEDKDNAYLAQQLNLPVEAIWEAWDFFESCGLIIKHRNEGALIGDYGVEFLDLSSLAQSAPKEKVLSVEELLVISENESYQAMYDAIEKATQMPLLPGDMLNLNKAIAQYGYNKDLVAEAFSYCAYKNKPRTPGTALGVLRTWHLSGIRTVEELRSFLAQKDERYGKYRQILSFLGEYRTATKAEREIMDTWLDEYDFSMEVIENACKKSTAIKSPNMNYIHGVLRNWREKITQQGEMLHRCPNKDETEFRLRVLDLLGHKGPLQKSDVDSLRFLFENFPFTDVSQGIEFLRQRGEAPSLLNLYQLFRDPSGKTAPLPTPGGQEGSIRMEEVQRVMGTGKKGTKKEKGPSELEQKLVKRRQNPREG